MFREPPCWKPDASSATVLMEYVQRASSQFVAAELDKLGLLRAADEAADAVLEQVAREASERHRLMTASLRAPKLAAMVALAMCATIVIIAQTRYGGAIHLLEDDGSRFMQLAGPTPEW
jgi:hypothetical protein